MSCSCVAAPSPLLGVTDSTEIAAGYEFGISLGADGRVKSWGYNHGGELGNGTTDLNPVPATVPGLSNVVAVAAGSEFALALLGDGSVMAWGENNYGQLGLDPAGPETLQHGQVQPDSAGRFPGVANAIAISAYGYHSMALLADGTVLSWGADEQGQQGDGVGLQTGCRCVPTPHPIAAASGAVAIAAGYYTGAALFADGSVRNWGGNGRGRARHRTGLGAGPGCQCLGPVSPAGLPPVAQISSGAAGSVALLQTGGTLGWGHNYHGQVGNGSKSTCAAVLLRPIAHAGHRPHEPARVVAGGEHAVALLADGTLAAWGDNQYGLGNGTDSGGDVTIATPVQGVSGASEAAAGEYNTYAIIGPSHELQGRVRRRRHGNGRRPRHRLPAGLRAALSGGPGRGSARPAARRPSPGSAAPAPGRAPAGEDGRRPDRRRRPSAAKGDDDHESEDRAPQEAGDIRASRRRRDHRLRMHAGAQADETA